MTDTATERVRTAPRRSERMALVAILLVAAVLRLGALDRVPPGPSYDELQNARLSERVLQGKGAIYYAENFGQEPLYPALEALATRLLGRNLVALRIPAALAGLISVLVVYLAGRRLSTRRAALLGAGFQAVSFWPMLESRLGLEMALLPPLSALALLFLARALGEEAGSRGHNLANFGAAGILLGGHVYAYTAGRVMPLLPLALLPWLAILAPAKIRRHWAGLVVLCVVIGLIVAPLAVFLYRHPEAEHRLEQLSGPLEALRDGDPRPVLDLSVGTLAMFSFRGEPQWLYNIADRPVFDPLTSFLFYVGLAWCFVHGRDWRRGLVLLWLVVGLGPGMASPPAGSFSHTLAAQPAVYLILGAGADATWRWLSQRRGWLGAAVVTGVMALHLGLSCRACFDVWPTAPEVTELYQGGVTAVARQLDAHDPVGPVAAGGPYVNHWHPWNAVGFDLALRREDLQVRWFDPGDAWILPHGRGPVSFYFPDDPLGELAFDGELAELFATDALSVAGSADPFVAWEVTAPEAFNARVNAAAETKVASRGGGGSESDVVLPVAFGDRFRLLGADVPRGSLVPGTELRVLTYWEVLGADASAVVSFVHLTSGGSAIWGQHDGLDVWPPSLQPGDVFVQVHRVPLAPEAPDGSYYFVVGLYHPETFERLPVTVEGEPVADSVRVGRELSLSP